MTSAAYLNNQAITDSVVSFVSNINSVFFRGGYCGKKLFRINLSNGPTCVTPSTWGWYHFDIMLNLEQVYEYAEIAQITDLSAAKALICHEVYHVLLDHFNPKYRKYEHNLFNIAADLEINSYLNLDGKIALRAAKYGLKDFYPAEQYYHLLENMGEKSKPKSKPSSPTDTSDSGEGGNQATNSDQGSNQQGEGEAPNDKPDNKGGSDKDKDLQIDDIFNTTENDAAKISEIVNSLKKQIGNGSILRAATSITKEFQHLYETSKVDGLKELLNKLIREESTMAISAKTRESTYKKFNNRRKNGDIILPGKQLNGDGLKKKFQKSLTVFIDMSGSTYNINDTLNTVAFKFHNKGATIVFYDTRVLDIVEPDKPFRSMASCGGTQISNAIKTYLTDHKLERAYVITDGVDNTIRTLGDVTDKYTVYLIDRNRIREYCSNKKPLGGQKK